VAQAPDEQKHPLLFSIGCLLDVLKVILKAYEIYMFSSSIRRHEKRPPWQWMEGWADAPVYLMSWRWFWKPNIYIGFPSSAGRRDRGRPASGRRASKSGRSSSMWARAHPWWAS